ncbi:serine hydrolase [Streptococcus suis]|uniref:serine hydrolase n=1 Tax=Streptococcus suis TaxID=1307 RepID=UPI003D766E0F
MNQLWMQDSVRNNQESVAVQLDHSPETSSGQMRRKRKKVFTFKDWFRLPYLLGILAVILVGSIFWVSQQKEGSSTLTTETSTTNLAETDSDGKESLTQTEPTVRPVYKSLAERELALQEDLAYMDSLYLYYDYVHLSLEETVRAFLAEQGLDPSQVAFTYKNLQTNEVFSMNDTQPMTAGSTYKLPLNMLVVDAVENGEVSATEAYDITATRYEYKPEHDAYVANYNGKMTIADMQYGSIVVSENTPAYALSERIGGMVAAYGMFGRYGQSKNPDIPTFSLEGNKTTSSYYTQVLDYLYQHQSKYADLLTYLDLAFPGDWYEEYVHGVTVYQKPGYVREALNVDAIVMEETPYSIALYTAHFGGASEDDLEIDGFGYNQVVALAYVINQWHRINMNPAKKAMVGHYPI